MNAAVMSGAAQAIASSAFGATPPGFRPVPVTAPGSALIRYGPRVLRPSPGYGKRKSAPASGADGRAARVTMRGAENGISRDYGTARAYPAEFAVRPNLMGLADGGFAPVRLDTAGAAPDWAWSGPAIPLVGMVAGAALGATLSKRWYVGGAVGAIVGWLTLAGTLAATRAGQVQLR